MLRATPGKPGERRVTRLNPDQDTPVEPPEEISFGGFLHPAKADNFAKIMRTIHQNNNYFERFLITTAVVIISVGAYETYTELYRPAQSVLHLFHSLGYLNDYEAVFAPGKGVWLLNAWIGSIMMAVMMIYSLRKRLTILRSFGNIRHWLSLHMFLGVTGPIFITSHTTFKFGGIVATSYWCMMVTMLFGILGRYIYVQIPRSLSGTEMKADEIEHAIAGIDIKLGRYLSGINISDLSREISSSTEKSDDMGMFNALFLMFRMDIANLIKIRHLNKILKKRHSLNWKARREVIFLLRHKASMIRKKNFLYTSRRLLQYWHVFHIPLAFVMFFIMGLHIVVYYLFRPE